MYEMSILSFEIIYSTPVYSTNGGFSSLIDVVSPCETELLFALGIFVVALKDPVLREALSCWSSDAGLALVLETFVSSTHPETKANTLSIIITEITILVTTYITHQK